MDEKKIQEGVRLILEGIGEDCTREGLLETPDRIARMYQEIFGGMGKLTFSTFTGRNVPNPTWSVTSAIWTPFSRIVCNSSGVKCSPAVGAAAEPSYFAYTV